MKNRRNFIQLGVWIKHSHKKWKSVLMTMNKVWYLAVMHICSDAAIMWCYRCELWANSSKNIRENSLFSKITDWKSPVLPKIILFCIFQGFSFFSSSVIFSLKTLISQNVLCCLLFYLLQRCFIKRHKCLKTICNPLDIYMFKANNGITTLSMFPSREPLSQSALY